MIEEEYVKRIEKLEEVAQKGGGGKGGIIVGIIALIVAIGLAAGSWYLLNSKISSVNDDAQKMVKTSKETMTAANTAKEEAATSATTAGEKAVAAEESAKTAKSAEKGALGAEKASKKYAEASDASAEKAKKSEEAAAGYAQQCERYAESCTGNGAPPSDTANADDAQKTDKKVAKKGKKRGKKGKGKKRGGKSLASRVTALEDDVNNLKAGQMALVDRANKFETNISVLTEQILVRERLQANRRR